MSITDEVREEYGLDEGINPEKDTILGESFIRKFDSKGKMDPTYERAYKKWSIQEANALLNEEDYSKLQAAKEKYGRRPKVLKRIYKNILKSAMKRKGREQDEEKRLKNAKILGMVEEECQLLRELTEASVEELEREIDREPASETLSPTRGE